MRLDPLSLKLFIGVVEHGSIASAAEENHIAPAAVSKRMSELESALCTPLLMRTNKGAQATPAGLALLHLARRLLVDLDDIAVQMREWSGGTRGQVRVYANISAITQFLPSEIAAFLARYPEVDVHLQERVSPVIVKAVLENEADVGVCLLNAPAPGLEVFRTTRTSWCSSRRAAMRSRSSAALRSRRRWATTSSGCTPAARSMRNSPAPRLPPSAACGCASR
jgi:DNA-binding transcriptional LysR family regulator